MESSPQCWIMITIITTLKSRRVHLQMNGCQKINESAQKLGRHQDGANVKTVLVDQLLRQHCYSKCKLQCNHWSIRTGRAHYGTLDVMFSNHNNILIYNIYITIDGWHVIQRRVSHSQTDKEWILKKKKMLHLPVFKPRMYFYPAFAFLLRHLATNCQESSVAEADTMQTRSCCFQSCFLW